MFRKDKAKLRYYPLWPAGYSKPKVTASNQQTFYTVGDELVAFKNCVYTKFRLETIASGGSQHILEQIILAIGLR